jgi:1-acyl-sn-glycerol-3-phosphate acyltransferase
MSASGMPGKRDDGRRIARLSALRRLAALAYGAYAWLLFGLLFPPIAILLPLLRRPARARTLARSGARLLFFLLGMRIEAEGLGHLPESPHLLLLNHASFLDGIALVALLPAHPGHAFVVRQQFRSQSLLCPLLHAVGVLVLTPVGMYQRGRDVALMTAALRRGQSLVVFPEGGFRSQRGLGRFHSGALAAAAGVGVPVVAAGLSGTRDALPLGSWMPRRTGIALRIGRSWSASSHSLADLRRMAAALRQEVSRLCGEATLGTEADFQAHTVVDEKQERIPDSH